MFFVDSAVKSLIPGATSIGFSVSPFTTILTLPAGIKPTLGKEGFQRGQKGSQQKGHPHHKISNIHCQHKGHS